MSARQDAASTSTNTSPTKRRATPTPVRTLAASAIEAALDKKARGITVMDMRDVSGMADFFVVCTGESDLQIKAIVDAIEERLRTEHAERPWHVEGRDHRQWVLMDYVDLVVHVFDEERRTFYDLERLWGDAPSETVSDDADDAQGIALLQEAA